MEDGSKARHVTVHERVDSNGEISGSKEDTGWATGVILRLIALSRTTTGFTNVHGLNQRDRRNITCAKAGTAAWQRTGLNNVPVWQLLSQ